MKARILAIVLTSAALAACSTGYESEMNKVSGTGDEVADQQVAKTERDDGYQCKRVQITGTRMSEKICTTAAQREEQRRGAQEGVQGFQNRSNQTNLPSN
jgi:hypothetical protein